MMHDLGQTPALWFHGLEHTREQYVIRNILKHPSQKTAFYFSEYFRKKK
jgi:hypothetical protein